MNGEIEGLCGFEVDRVANTGHPLYRQLARLRTLQDFGNVARIQAPDLVEIHFVRNQGTCFSISQVRR